MKALKTKPAELVAKALNGVLFAEANSTSCFIVYQPKAPKVWKDSKRLKNESNCELVKQMAY